MPLRADMMADLCRHRAGNLSCAFLHSAGGVGTIRPVKQQAGTWVARLFRLLGRDRVAVDRGAPSWASLWRPDSSG